MSLTIYSRDDCIYCDKAKRLVTSRHVPYTEIHCENVAELRTKLGPFARSLSKLSFPLIVDGHGKLLGGFGQLRDVLDEPILTENIGRFSAFPIRHHDVYDLYKKAVASFWTSDEISLRDDATHFQELTDDERHFIKHILAFFASSDGIVNENLMSNFSKEVQLSESRLFYAFQAFNEAEHNVTYSMLIDAIVTDNAERDRLFNAIVEIPAVQRKASWAMKWLDPSSRTFAERLVAYACVEGVLFSGSFCSIFWLKKAHPGKMPGLSLSNQFISRDEALHCQHASMLYRKLRHPLSQDEVEAIVREAVENEKLFITDALPCSLVGINPKLMSKYIEFVADRLLVDLGHERMFFTENPFAWMELISLEGKTNFFESRVSEYSRASMMGGSTDSFAVDNDF